MFGWSFQQQAKQLNLGSAVLEAVKSISSESKRWRRVQYADEVIVVIKPEPEKAGNRLEDKTQVTWNTVSMAIAAQKAVIGAKDERDSKVFKN